MLKRYRYRIYPHPHQKQSLARAFGCARVVWNDALDYSKKAKQEGKDYPSDAEVSKVCITDAKKTVERAWLADAPAVVLQQSLRDQQQAKRNWWRSLKGKGKAKAPRYKRRNYRQSIRFPRNGFKCSDKTIYLSKIGKIPVVWNRALPGVPSSATIIKDRANRYFVSFVVDVDEPEAPKVSKTIGLDLGLESFVTTSDGKRVAPPKYLKSALRSLRRLNRSLSSKIKGSKNRSKARLKLAKLHAKVADKRLDFLHKLSTQLICENQTIVIEDLCVAGMMKNRWLARAIADSGWRTFRALLEAKATEHGRNLIVIDRFTPTSQVCSCCGYDGGKKPLNVRQWMCSKCGATHDRDINAAINILAAGHAESLNDCGARCKTYFANTLLKQSASEAGAGNEAVTHLNQVKSLI